MKVTAHQMKVLKKGFLEEGEGEEGEGEGEREGGGRKPPVMRLWGSLHRAGERGGKDPLSSVPETLQQHQTSQLAAVVASQMSLTQL